MSALQLPRNRPSSPGDQLPVHIDMIDATSLRGVVKLHAVSQTASLPSVPAQLRLDQAWFWSEEWQAMEAEAEADLREGRYTDFDTFDDLISHLGDLTQA